MFLKILTVSTDPLAVSGTLPWTAATSNAHTFLARALEHAEAGDLEAYASCLRLAGSFATSAAHAAKLEV